MAVKEIKDMGASVLTRLKEQAKETGSNYQTCLQLFAQEEFLRKLEMSQYVENLVLKGGMFLYTISNFEGRPTMDIDFMLRKMSNDVAGMEVIIKEGKCMEIAEAALFQMLGKIFYYDKIALLKFVHSTEMRNIYATKQNIRIL